MLTSAMRRMVKTAAKSQKVVITEAEEISEIAAFVGRRSCTVQGWRPTSATIQPASEHIHIRGPDAIAIICSHLCRKSQSFLYTANKATTKNKRK